MSGPSLQTVRPSDRRFLMALYEKYGADCFTVKEARAAGIICPRATVAWYHVSKWLSRAGSTVRDKGIWRLSEEAVAQLEYHDRHRPMFLQNRLLVLDVEEIA